MLKKLSITFALSLLAAPAVAADTLRQDIAAEMPELMEIYRDLHANPELSFAEFRTAGIMAQQMRRLGFEVTEKIGKTGVVAIMRNGPGPVVMLRADMDGLPVVEQTGLPYASKRVATPASGVETGVMHACGHDTHMAGWIGAARLLVARKQEWSGTLMMVAQPAEELGDGARAMLKDGLFEKFPVPDYALAFHDAAQLAAGKIAYAPGYAMANVDMVDIAVPGVGGHGAYPHTAKDPVLLASAIVMKLQTIVSRESNPLDPAVITVGSFHAGSKHNIISDEAKLQLTVRSYSDESRALLLDGIRRVAHAEALSIGMPEDRLPIVSVQEPHTPAVFNNPDMSEEMAGLFRGRFGNDAVLQAPPVMGGEDFSEYRRVEPNKTRSMLFWVGGARAEEIAAAEAGKKNLPSLHSPFWAPDAEKVIATGAEGLAAAALHYLRPTES